VTATVPSAAGAAGTAGAVDRGPERIDVVVPTVGRSSLCGLVWVLHRALPAAGRVLVVDDRPDPTPPLDVGVDDPRIVVVASCGRGPAAARNVGWRSSTADWIAFLDDDVEPPLGWLRSLRKDVDRADPDVGALQGRIEVPLPAGRPATDWERNVAGLEGAPWITADLVVRRAALEHVGGFDDRFARAYREDTDLALRLLDGGWRLELGHRRVRHPVRPADWWASVRLQRGNADDVLLERLHGQAWRERLGAHPGARSSYPATLAAGLAGVAALAAGRRRVAALAAAVWAGRTACFAWRRIGPGPRTGREVATMVVTSMAIPPAATWHRARGWIRWRSVERARVRPLPDRPASGTHAAAPSAAGRLSR
jgi:Glycosyl transferase family 2